jgi:8-oxo-dGTP pyrophosphatase MutT (NUDIX family)
MSTSRIDETVLRVSSCRLTVEPSVWPYEQANAAPIDAAWELRLARHPHEFNGVVHMARASTLALNTNADATATWTCTAGMWRTDFKSFMHWRDAGYPEADALDAFGSVILRSADGAVLLGRQRSGINAGRVYLPGGFIDARDVGDDGTIDIDSSVSRELAEETGLEAASLARRPGYLVTRVGRLLSIGVEFHSTLPSVELRTLILRTIASDPDPELDDIVIVSAAADVTGPLVPDYTRLAVQHLLAEKQITPTSEKSR